MDDDSTPQQKPLDTVDPLFKHISKCKQMNIISYVKQPLVFHVLKEAVKYIETSTENVSPESFYSLVMAAPSSNEAASIRAS